MTRLLPGEMARPDLPPPRDRRASQILSAYRRILETEGLQAASMRRVADALGMQAPSLYKHFSSKAEIEAALVADALVELGEAAHGSLHVRPAGSPLMSLLVTYRERCVANAALYRLATQGSFYRALLPPGLEEWAGNPFYVVTGDPSLAQALWSFAHGMVVLELDNRYPDGSDLDSTWHAGGTAFERYAATKEVPRANSQKTLSH